MSKNIHFLKSASFLNSIVLLAVCVLFLCFPLSYSLADDKVQGTEKLKEKTEKTVESAPDSQIELEPEAEPLPIEDDDAEEEVQAVEELEDLEAEELTKEQEEKAEEALEETTKEVEASDTEQSTAKFQARRAVGYIERIKLYPERLYFDAKLAPGSEGNVLHAEELEKFQKDGKDWIRFKVTDRKGKTVLLERLLVASRGVKTTKGKVKKRYTIRSGFCLGSRYMEVDFALADRSDFNEEARIGRDALAGHFVIDPAMTKTTTPKCKVVKKHTKES